MAKRKTKMVRKNMVKKVKLKIKTMKKPAKSIFGGKQTL